VTAERFRSFAAALGACCSLSGCDAEVTSIGAWSEDVATSLYLEAEGGQLSTGFTVGSDAQASEEHFIEPPLGVSSEDGPGSAQARYVFDVPVDADYVIWGRVQTPNEINNRFWFRVDGASWHLWRISVGEIWVWDDLHEDR
jgi:hypothetical protein